MSKNIINENTSVLVTGGSGLVGSHVLRKLVDENEFDFTVLVRNEQQAKIWNTFGIKTVIGDLEKQNFSLPSSITTIIHIAAIAGDWVDRKKAHTVNVVGTEHLLKEAEKIGCKKFIYVSTIGVYGHEKYVDATEGKKLKASSTYERTKLQADKFIQKYAKTAPNGMELIIIRPSSMYGEGDRYIIPAYSRYLKNGKMVLIGGGKSLYPIMHAEDTASVLVQLIDGHYSNGNKLAIYNLCDGSRISQKEFISLIKDNLGVEGDLSSIPYLPAYLASIFFEIKGKLTKTEPRIFRKRVKYLGITRNVSIDKARTELDFKPKWSPQEGVPMVLKLLEEEERYKANGIETSIINGFKEKEILDIIPYHLFKVLKENNVENN